MAAPGMTSPIRTAAFDNLQLNAGVFLVGFDYSSITDSTALKTAIKTAISTPANILGVTRGGGSFTVTRERRVPEVDGIRYPFVGGEFIDSADAYLSGTSLEVNPTNWQRFLTSATATTSGKKTTLKMHTAIDAANDYLDHLCWVGDISDGRCVLIELDNAMNTADFSFTFQDKNEGTVPFEFHAHQDDVGDYDEAPFRIVFFDNPST